MNTTITTARGVFSKERLDALTNVRFHALKALRNSLDDSGFREVTTSSLVNVAGSCENPNASFRLNYYGREAHLSQSAQIQLEMLILRLKKAFYTVNTSFREETYDDPENETRHLGEFTLVEAEFPSNKTDPEQILDELIAFEEKTVKHGLRSVLTHCPSDIAFLGGNINALEKSAKEAFGRVSYTQAIAILNEKNKGHYNFGDDLGIREEQALLHHFNSTPVFITGFPAKIKFFNMKKTDDGQSTYSVDLIAPRLGEMSGGAVREEKKDKIENYLQSSKIAQTVDQRLGPGATIQQFSEYFAALAQEGPVPRAGFGIGFERFIGFILNSSDILNTIEHRSMQP
jgi:asparaginyl-tRNA synthetase